MRCLYFFWCWLHVGGSLAQHSVPKAISELSPSLSFRTVALTMTMANQKKKKRKERRGQHDCWREGVWTIFRPWNVLNIWLWVLSKFSPLIQNSNDYSLISFWKTTFIFIFYFACPIDDVVFNIFPGKSNWIRYRDMGGKWGCIIFAAFLGLLFIFCRLFFSIS